MRGLYRSFGSVAVFPFVLFHISPVFHYPFRAILPTPSRGSLLLLWWWTCRRKRLLSLPLPPQAFTAVCLNTQGHWGVASGDQSLTPQPFCGQPVLQSLRLEDWLVSLDLQDAYLQVPVHPASCRFLRFCVGESVYQFRSLCFGLSTALQVFTHVMAPVSSIMHRYGFRILRYLDDWLILGSSFQEIVRARDFLLWLCQELGIRINLAKSSLMPSQLIDYI